MLTRLFTPLRIGPTELKNRIVSTGHDTVMIEDGLVTDQLVAYQAARAAGGAGLIVLQVGGVHESAKYTSHALMAHTDECIPGYRRLADVGHEHGCLVYAQLFHGGREVMESEDGSLGVSYAASAVPNERFRVFPRAMDIGLVREVIEGFGAAAQRLQAAGLDGVEIVASHGYLPPSSSAPAPTCAPTSTAARSRTACGSCGRCWRRSGGARTARWPSACGSASARTARTA